MRALLLAAGLGTRLRPITHAVPKCLIPIKGEPLLKIWLENLSRAGMGPFLVNTHYLAEQVNAYLQVSPFANQVTLVHEENLLGTAGTLIANLNFFDGEDCMLIHADNFCLAGFSAFARAHRERPPECLMTMLTFRSDAPSQCGIVELDKRDVVTHFHEKVAAPPGNLANGAIYCLSREMLKILRTEMMTVKDFSTEVLPRFMGRIFTYKTDSVLIDVGSPTAYRKANRWDHPQVI